MKVLNILAAMTAGLLLATVGPGGRAFAAVDCGAKSVDHVASTLCLEHHPRASVHGSVKTQRTVKPKDAAMTAGEPDGDELTPVSPVVASRIRAAPTAWHLKLFGETPPTFTDGDGQASDGASLWRAHDAPSTSPWPPSSDISIAARPTAKARTWRSGAISPGDLVHGGASVPAVAAWAILLMGLLLGLGAILRQPRVARAESWAMSSLSSSMARSAAKVGPVDRVDPARYIESPARRSHQGHFVRDAAPAHFGVGV